MKMWKKLMAFAGALLLITAILAAQYVSVQVDSIVVGIETQEAGLQIGAGDLTVNSTGLGDQNHNYLLEYEDGFQLNLGTWGEQNAFTSTAAFFIANAMPTDVYIIGFEVIDGSAPATLGDAGITMYLHNNSHAAEIGGVENEDWINVETLAPNNYIHLAGVTDAYDIGEGDLTIATDGDDLTANWVESRTGGDSLWYLEPGEIGGLGINEDRDASAVWVRVEISPELLLEEGDFGIRFLTASEV